MPRHSITVLTIPTTLFFILILLLDVVSAQHWTMVDDTDAAIKYTPASNWFQGPCGPSCMYPNLTNVHNETWHVTQPGRSSGTTTASLTFTGYSLVVGLLLDNVDSMHTSITIDLDGNSLDYYHDSQHDGTIQTNAVIYYKDGLTYTPHTLTITVYAESILMLDYIAFQDSLTNTPAPPASPPPEPSQSASASRPPTGQSTTSKTVAVGPSGTTTLAVTLPVTTGSLSGLDTLSRATTTFDPSTFSLSNLQQLSVQLSTTVDPDGHTVVIPVLTVTEGAYGSPTGIAGHNNSSSTAFDPALAGAIGAAVAAISAALIVVFLVCMRRRKRIRPRPSSAEPYMLANSTPSSQNSSLTPRLSPYLAESVLGLFTVPQAPDHRTQPDFLLSSPPPNDSLMSPISPSRQFYPSQNITVTTPSTEQYLNPYSNSNSLSTPISPNYPQPYYSHNQPQYQPPNQHYYQYPVDKLSRHPSNNYLSAQRNMAELRSPVTPLIPRPADWNIESRSEPGEAQTGVALAPNSPAMLLPSPAILTPTPPSPHRRRSGRQKEIVEEQPAPSPVRTNLSGVPILGHPSALRRGRRRTDGADIHLRAERNPASDEESLPPVVRRQSLSHPAPPAYSPPRLVRNTDLHDVLLD